MMMIENLFNVAILEHITTLYIILTVQFESIEVRGDESAGTLIFTLVTDKPADNTFTVQVSTRQLNETGVGIATG